MLAGLFVLVAGVGLADDTDQSTWQPRLGLDLQVGTRITLQARSTDDDVTSDKLAQARSIIDQRVNATGVSEAEVTTQGGDQVVIEIPGEQRGNIVDEVGRTAQLRFRLVWAGQLTGATGEPDADAVKEAQKTIDDTDWAALTLDQQIGAETQGLQTLPEEYTDGVAAVQGHAAEDEGSGHHRAHQTSPGQARQAGDHRGPGAGRDLIVATSRPVRRVQAFPAHAHIPFSTA